MEFIKGMWDALWSLEVSFFQDVLHNGSDVMAWIGLVCVTIGLLTILAVAGFILYGIFYLLDTAFVSTQQQTGEVFKKQKYAASTTMVAAPVVGGDGGVAMVPTYVPPSWHIGVKVGDRYGWMSCSKSFYKKIEPGDRLMVTYGIRRLTRKLKITHLATI